MFWRKKGEEKKVRKKSEKERKVRKKSDKEREIAEYVSIHDIDGFLKFTSGALLESKVEKATAAQLRGMRTVNLGLVMTIATLLVAGGVATVLITGALSNTECVNKLAEIAKQSKKVVTIEEGGKGPGPQTKPKPLTPPSTPSPPTPPTPPGAVIK